jgi:tetratricopeptide (TPR) repeat protein
MSNLIIDLENIPQDTPFVYEVYPDDNREMLESYIENCSETTIVVTYDARINKELFCHFWITDVYNQFRLSPPEIKFKIAEVSNSFAKLAFGIVDTVLSSTAPTTNSYFEPKSSSPLENTTHWNTHDITDILVKFRKASRDLQNGDVLILSAIRLLLEISIKRRIIFWIKNSQDLSITDLQFLRTYYGLFKDSTSRNKMKSSFGRGLFVGDSVVSQVLTILDWSEWDPRQFNIKSTSRSEMAVNEFRWFLRRYGLVDDTELDGASQVISNDIFVGRRQILKSLINHLNNVAGGSGAESVLVKGPTGIGKTTLSREFMRHFNALSYHVVGLYSGFSGEHTDLSTGLPEIRAHINALRFELDSSFSHRIRRLLESDVGTNEKARNIRNFIRTFYLHQEDILTFFSNMISSSSFGETLSGFSLFLSAVECYKSLQELFVHKSPLKLRLLDDAREDANWEFLDELVEEFVRLLSLIPVINGKPNKTIVWIVDDIQWMDATSAEFFAKLIQHAAYPSLPLLLLFMERESDIYGRSDERIQLLTQLIPDNYTYGIDGFDLDDLKELLYAGVGSDKQISDQVAVAIWGFFTDGHTNRKIEPIFLIEAINLLYDPTDVTQSVILKDTRYNCWVWNAASFEELEPIVQKAFSKWVLQHRKSSRVACVVEERLYRLLRHFGPSIGGQVIEFLEISSFIGEPFSYSLIRRFFNSLQKSLSLTANHVAYLETLYRLLFRYRFQDSYLFSHSLYREYLRSRRTWNSQDHLVAFQALSSEIDADSAIENSELQIALKTLAVRHGELLEDVEVANVCLRYLQDIADHKLSRYEFSNALELCEQGLVLSRRLYGNDKPVTWGWVHRIGIIFRKLGRAEDAKNAYISIIDKISSEILSDTISSLSDEDLELVIGMLMNMALCFRDTGDLTSAEFFALLASEVLEHVDVENTDVEFCVTCLNNIGNILYWVGKVDLSRMLFRQALNCCDEELIDDPELIASIYANFAKFVRGTDRKALDYLLKAKQLLETAEEKDNTLMIVINHRIVEELIWRREYKDAKILAHDTLIRSRELLHDQHPYYGDSLFMLGLALFSDRSNISKALELCDEALRIFTNASMKIHAAQTMELMGRILTVMDRCVEAEHYLTSAVEYLVENLGTDHSATCQAMDAYSLLWLKTPQPTVNHVIETALEINSVNMIPAIRNILIRCLLDGKLDLLKIATRRMLIILNGVDVQEALRKFFDETTSQKTLVLFAECAKLCGKYRQAHDFEMHANSISNLTEDDDVIFGYRLLSESLQEHNQKRPRRIHRRKKRR